MFKIKPKFWDKKYLTFLSVIFYPISIILILIFKLKSLKKGEKFSIPVICIGNIYVGGTGKTPLAIKLYDIIASFNKKPAFVKKYYNYLDDEISLLKQKGKVYFLNSRIKCIKELIKDHFQVAILDDGFQDFSVQKDISIITMNSKQLFGNKMVIPAGPLRETISGIKRADCVMINGKKELSIENDLKSHNPSLKIFYFKYELLNYERFKDKKIIAFAGIGNPNNFFDILKEYNLNSIKFLSFPDHHKFSKNEIQEILNLSKTNNALLVTTEKDHLRLNDDFKSKIYFLKINLKIDNENNFLNFIKEKI